MNASAQKRILVIKLGALGDFIQALGPMAAIRRHHADAHITLLTTKAFETLARACGYFDDVWLDSRPKWHNVKGWLALRARFNDGSFVRVYDLQNNDRTSCYLKLFSPRPEWVGVAKGASHRNTSSERTKGNAFDGHVQTLALAGVKDVSVDRLEWMTGAQGFELQTPYVLVVPGSAPSRPEKRWPQDCYAGLCKTLVVHGYTPVLIGTRDEQETLSAIQSSVPQVVNLCGQTKLTDIPALARSAYGAIGNDTGPMHLIAPTGCASIILFSKASNPKRHAPLGQHVITMQKPDLSNLSVDEVWKIFELQHAPS